MSELGTVLTLVEQDSADEAQRWFEALCDLFEEVRGADDSWARFRDGWPAFAGSRGLSAERAERFCGELERLSTSPPEQLEEVLAHRADLTAWWYDAVAERDGPAAAPGGTTAAGSRNLNRDGTPGTDFYRFDEASGQYLYAPAADSAHWATYEQRRYSEPARDEAYGLNYRLDRTHQVYEWYDEALGRWQDQTWADLYAVRRAGAAPEIPVQDSAAEWDENWAMFYRVGLGGVYEFADAVTPGERSSGCGQVWLSHEQVLLRASQERHARSALHSIVVNDRKGNLQDWLAAYRRTNYSYGIPTVSTGRKGGDASGGSNARWQYAIAFDLTNYTFAKEIFGIDYTEPDKSPAGVDRLWMNAATLKEATEIAISGGGVDEVTFFTPIPAAKIVGHMLLTDGPPYLRNQWRPFTGEDLSGYRKVLMKYGEFAFPE